MARTSTRTEHRGLGARLAERNRQGLARVRGGFLQSVQITLAAVIAYVIAERLLGHHGPIFAATAAIVSLGYGNGAAHLRRILEVSIGCTLGIVIGDVLMYFLGRGVWQASLVLLLSVLLARYLDNGTIFTTQMGLQSVLVVLLPPAMDGPFARSLDAVIGGLCALAIMAVFPTDPGREPRQEMRKLTKQFSAAMRESAQAIGDYDAAAAWAALERARRIQPQLNAVEGSLRIGRDRARIKLSRRGHRAQIEGYQHTLQGLDNAVRNTRVLARRIANVVQTVQLRPEAVQSLHEVLTELAQAVNLIGMSLTADTAESRAGFRQRAQDLLTRAAEGLDPQTMGVRTYQGEALVMLIRPLTVDLLVATGMSEEEAADAPVTIKQALTEAIAVVDPQRDPRRKRNHGSRRGPEAGGR